MRIHEVPSILIPAAVEFTLSICMAVIFPVLNYMLVYMFPKISSFISMTLIVAMLVLYYTFARSSLDNITKTSRLFNKIKEWIR